MHRPLSSIFEGQGLNAMLKGGGNVDIFPYRSICLSIVEFSWNIFFSNALTRVAQVSPISSDPGRHVALAPASISIGDH